MVLKEGLSKELKSLKTEYSECLSKHSIKQKEIQIQIKHVKDTINKLVNECVKCIFEQQNTLINELNEINDQVNKKYDYIGECLNGAHSRIKQIENKLEQNDQKHLTHLKSELALMKLEVDERSNEIEVTADNSCIFFETNRAVIDLKSFTIGRINRTKKVFERVLNMYFLLKKMILF